MPNSIQKPKGAEAGYLYDYVRQQQNKKLDQIKNNKKFKKKMNKLSGKDHYYKAKK